MMKLSGSEEAAEQMDVTYTEFVLQLNFNTIFQNAYEKCRDDPSCDFDEVEMERLISLYRIEDNEDYHRSLF